MIIRGDVTIARQTVRVSFVRNASPKETMLATKFRNIKILLASVIAVTPMLGKDFALNIKHHTKRKSVNSSKRILTIRSSLKVMARI